MSLSPLSPPRSTRWRPGPLLWLLLILCVVYLPLFFGQILFFRDPAHWNYPARWFVRASLLRGDVPTWNPDQGLGFSVLGNPLYGLFYPPNWLFLVGGEEAAARLVTWQSFGHLVWGAAGTILLARRLGASVVGQAVAGLAWALSGFTTSMWTAGLLLLSGAWLPWCAVGFIALARSQREAGGSSLTGVVKAALPVAMALLLGEVFVAMMAVGFGVVTALVAERRGLGRVAGPDIRRFVLGLGAALVLAAGIGAVAVLPARTISASGDRAAPLTRSLAEVCSLHPLRILEMTAPQALGNVYDRFPASKWVGEPALAGLPLAFSVYLGTSVLALAIVALGRGRRLSAALGVLVLAALLICLGRHLPVHQWFRTIVRPLGYMRYPEKYFVLVVGWVSLLAGLGVTRIFADPQRQPWRRTVAFAALLLFAALVAPVVFPIEFSGHARVALFKGVAAVAGVLAAQFFAGRRARLAGVLLVGAVSCDLAAATWPLQSFAPVQLALRPPEVASAILADHKDPTTRPRVYRAQMVEDSVRRFTRTRTAADAEFRSIKTLVPNHAITFGVATMAGYDAALPAVYTTVWDAGQGVGQNLLRLFGVGYAILPVDNPMQPDRRAGLRPMMDPLPGARLYRVQDPLPRVYLAGRADLRDDGDAIKNLFSADVLAGGQVWLAPTADARAIAGAAERTGDCKLESFSNDRLRATCQARRPGVAVFIEQYDAGWRADVDGQPAPLWRANVLMRAVPLEAGTHTITLSYTPPGFRVGGILSLVAVLVLFGVGTAGFYRRRGRPAPL